MTETYESALERLRVVARGQAHHYWVLLESTRAGTDALRTQDLPNFERILAEQTETLRELTQLSREKEGALREIGFLPPSDAETQAITSRLNEVSRELRREQRVRHQVTQRLGATLETRIGFHRNAGTLPAKVPGGLDERA